MPDFDEREKTARNRRRGTHNRCREDSHDIRHEDQLLGVLFEQKRRYDPCGPHSEQSSEGSAHAGDHDTVGEQLSGELAPAGAERDPD